MLVEIWFNMTVTESGKTNRVSLETTVQNHAHAAHLSNGFWINQHAQCCSEASGVKYVPASQVISVEVVHA